MSSLTERRLSPIYDAIDDQNYKQALLLCAKALKRQPDALIVKALKALALERTGQDEEALTICEEVKNASCTDQGVLQALFLVYKALGKHEDIVSLYKSAWEQQKNNEEFACHWFMALVRLGNYKGQQQAAMEMHRRFKSTKYLFWSVMSMVLQGQQLPSGQNNLSYTLAERVMLKSVAENDIQTYEELQLLIIVLRAQNKSAEALEILNGDLGQRVKVQGEIERMKLELMAETKSWDVLEEFAKKLLRKNVDDWRAVTFYFDAVFNRLDSMTETEEKVQSIQNARIFLDELKACSDGQLRRGPYMAELELNKRTLAACVEVVEWTPSSIILSYFKMFGSKTCCFDDLRTYLDTMTDSKDITSLTEQLRSHLEDGNDVYRIQKHINYMKIEEYLGLHDFEDLKKFNDLTDELVNHYMDALQYGTQLVETEKQYGDDYIIMAAHTLFRAYMVDQKTSHLIKALTLLESASSKSVHNFQFKLLMIRLYQLLGMTKRSIELYKSMDIKQIQLDTMSHFLTHNIVSLAEFNDAVDALESTLPIYASGDVEAPEMIVQAYKYATFSQIQEFIEFRRRLANSLQRAVTNAELTRLQILQNGIRENVKQIFVDFPVPEPKDEFFENVSDNRDFTVMVGWGNSSRGKSSIQECTSPRGRKGVLWLKLYTLIHRVLATMVGASSADAVNDLSVLMGRIESTLVEARKGKEVTAQEISNAEIIIAIGNVINHVFAEDGTLVGSDILKPVAKSLQARILEIQDFLAKGQVHWKLFHMLTTFVEAVQYLTILEQTVQSHVAEKKKSEVSGTKSVRDELTNFQEEILKPLLDSLKTCVVEVKRISEESGSEGLDIPVGWSEDIKKHVVKVVGRWKDGSSATENVLRVIERCQVKVGQKNGRKK